MICGASWAVKKGLQRQEAWMGTFCTCVITCAGGAGTGTGTGTWTAFVLVMV